MKTLLLLCWLLPAIASAQARRVTLTISGNPGNPSRTNEMTIAANESIEPIAWYGYATTAVVTKNGSSFYWQAPNLNYPVAPRQIITGPASFRVISTWDTYIDGYVTFEITPQSFPPDKTVVIPQGQGANVILECSTNLIDWTTA